MDENPYIIFTHSDKIWVMPQKSLNVAFDMYQPSTVKGRILKGLIKICRNNEKVLLKLGCKKADLSYSKALKSYLEGITGKSDLKVAAYMGDCSSRQNNKVTLQVYDDEILCYVKITEDEEVEMAFNNEISSLKYLQERGIENVPKVLGDDEINGLKVFTQSTNKLLGDRVKLQFKRMHIDFIKDIVDNTVQKCVYEETDFYKSVQYLKENSVDLGNNAQSVINKALSTLEEELTGKESEYTFSHGDYTPWNVYFANRKIYSFDFEYCSQTMPPYIDVFHYLTQLSILGMHNEVGKTVHLYKKYRKILEEYIKDPDFIYMCYLVHIIGFYHHRTKDRIELIQDKIELWVGILNYFNVRRAKKQIFQKI